MLITRLSFGLGIHRNIAAHARAATMEVYHTVNEGEKRMILAHADVAAGVVNRTALTNDDIASHARLTSPNLNA